ACVEHLLVAIEDDRRRGTGEAPAEPEAGPYVGPQLQDLERVALEVDADCPTAGGEVVVDPARPCSKIDARMSTRPCDGRRMAKEVIGIAGQMRPQKAPQTAAVPLRLLQEFHCLQCSACCALQADRSLQMGNSGRANGRETDLRESLAKLRLVARHLSVRENAAAGPPVAEGARHHRSRRTDRIDEVQELLEGTSLDLSLEHAQHQAAPHQLTARFPRKHP